MPEPQNILLIRLKSIGDIMFTLPSVHQLHVAYPHARLAYLVSREHAPLLEGFHDLDKIICLDRSQFRRVHPFAALREGLSVWRKLRREHFSLVIDFQGYGETGYLTRCTGASQRWGTWYRAARRWAYTCAVQRDPGSHPAEGHLAMMQACGVPGSAVRNEFVVPKKAADEARDFLGRAGLLPGRPLLFIQPFTSSPDKDWPLDRYLAIAHESRKRGMQVLFGGGPADCEALASVTAAGFACSAGVPLLVSAGLMSLSTIALGGDTGLLHVAVASGVRVLMLMGSTGPGSCYPFRHRDWAVTPASGKRVAGITSGRVSEALEAAWCERKLSFQ